MTEVLRALAYLEARTLCRRLRYWVRSPLVWTALLLLLSMAVWAQTLAPPQAWDLSQNSLRIAAMATLALGTAMCVSGWTSTLQSPVVVSLADSSWVLTRPHGGQAFVLHRLLLAAATAGLLALPSAVASAALFRLPAHQIPIVVWAAAMSSLAVRVTGYATHVLYLRGVRLRVLRVFWTLVSLWILGLGGLRVAKGEEPARWDLLGETLWSLAAAFARPNVSLNGMVAASIGVIVASALVTCFCVGFEEEAIEVASQVAALMAAVQGVRGGDTALDDLVNTSLRKGIGSLPAIADLRGERAFLWRALAQYRRQTKPWQLTAHAAFLALFAVVLGRFGPPELISLPLVVMALSGVLAGCSRGLAEELGRVAFWAAPGSATRKVWWTMVLPLVENCTLGLVTGIALAGAAPGLHLANRVELAGIGVGCGLLSTAVVSAVATIRSTLLARVVLAFSLLLLVLSIIFLPDAAGWVLPAGALGGATITVGVVGVVSACALATRSRGSRSGLETRPEAG